MKHLDWGAFLLPKTFNLTQTAIGIVAASPDLEKQGGNRSFC
jgi:hypothetical protein